MKPFRALYRLIKPASTLDPARRQRRTIKQNLILCVIGLAISFVYIFQQNPVGVIFLLSFAFFLITQVTPPEDENSDPTNYW